MAMHKGEYAAKKLYDDWQDVAVRDGHAPSQEFSSYGNIKNCCRTSQFN
jgi:hypothetical protein